jgi:hypothetical protein
MKLLFAFVATATTLNCLVGFAVKTIYDERSEYFPVIINTVATESLLLRKDSLECQLN